MDAVPHRLPSPLEELAEPALERVGVRLALKRDDLIHPRIPGNKWRKLRLNVAEAVAAGHDTLLTFGGAYSNHLRATAAAGRLLGLATVGVVRGEELADRPLNPSLARAAADGMRLWFVSRSAYRVKHEPRALEELRERFGRFFVVPEGGSNAAAARGCVALGRELRGRADVVAVACGTGGTLAGLAAGLDPSAQRALGFPVLKGGGFLNGEVERLQREAFGGRRGRWELDGRFHCGGYARSDERLREFAGAFAARHGLAPEPVYVAKMLLGVHTLAAEGAFAPGTRIAAVVTG
ncbi:pyridoxal-phosphate dependent enzyme [Streptomyces sp. SL13]|uniref:Pyridoxal-phosphate dependent enzyme n=1 Tax=Streptantibioticus silvisoli TaxID=2705255 RepID=A0AA90K8R5_9ACTN|nr:pyridoxal-phosphate dependent enzyme [Streptantibioticus silvisoli]MDI5966498.1 pyridoxal-phosphate dependent enzyme [Streptantibioticus silvisoli]MDI5970348.1 pyridoxal-phosphate dependent enzyme [Streptantibioticus silvisoli]